MRACSLSSFLLQTLQIGYADDLPKNRDNKYIIIIISIQWLIEYDLINVFQFNAPPHINKIHM